MTTESATIILMSCKIQERREKEEIPSKEVFGEAVFKSLNLLILIEFSFIGAP